ncbi:type I restriction-modification system subunit M N-terminal domain-containing protein [Lysinibacillus sp. MHQ-1]|nr:type I restriction-modification system subunit M N-terminal domain-containing protein [Lysinibacillus sp. MHQ-1]
MIDLSTPLWKFTNMLRGYIDALEYKHVLASAMTLKYMETDDKFVIPEAAKWSNIVFQRQDLKNVLINSFKEIEAANHELGEIFCD